MGKKCFVDFGSFFQAYGRQEVLLPDGVDPEDMDAVLTYLRENWEKIPTPASDYVTGSHKLDEESIIVHWKETTDEPRFAEDGMSVENGLIRVEWSNLGEGWNGDYNPEDPGDEELLRFDVYIKRNGVWEEVEDSSYCTQIPAKTDKYILKSALKMLLKEYTGVLGADPEASVKRMGEQLSWISPKWFGQDPDRITRNMVRKGIGKGIIQFVKDPNCSGQNGTVCKIGDNWFYHGGLTAEEETPSGYAKNTPVEVQVNDVFETLEAFRKQPGYEDEYAYYTAFLREHLGEGVSQHAG